MNCTKCNGFGYTPNPHADVCPSCKGTGETVSKSVQKRIDIQKESGEEKNCKMVIGVDEGSQDGNL